MRKVKFLLISLMILTFSSCGKVEPTPVPGGPTPEPTIEPTPAPSEPTSEPTLDPLPEKNILEAYPRNIDIKDVNQLPYTIEAFLSNMSLNEEDGLYYYNRIDRKKSFYSMFYGGRVSFQWEIEKHENGYFSYIGSEDYQKYGLYNVSYIYLSCNHEIDLLSEQKTLINYSREEFKIYYNTSHDDYGYHFKFQYPFEIDGNKYILGVHDINANVNLSDEGIKYVNENSDFQIKLGQEISNIENFDEFEKDKYYNEGYSFTFWLPNDGVTYNVGYYLLGEYVLQNMTNDRKISDERYVTKIKIYNADKSVCGVNITMSLKEAESLLVSQGFIKLSDRNFSLGRVSVCLGKQNGEEEIGYILLELTQSIDITEDDFIFED